MPKLKFKIPLSARVKKELFNAAIGIAIGLFVLSLLTIVPSLLGS